jgi:hypothetical protein
MIETTHDLHPPQLLLASQTIASNGEREYIGKFIRDLPQYFTWENNPGLIDGLGINQEYEVRRNP